MPVPPRILYVADAYPHSLFASTPIGIVRALGKAGAEVESVFLSIDGSDVIPDLPHIHLLRCGKRSYRATVVALLKLMGFLYRNHSRFDVVIVEPNMVPALAPFVLVRRYLRRFPRLILDVRTQPVEVPANVRGRIADAKFDVALEFAFRFFDGMLVITEEMARYLRERKGRNPLPTGIWTSGINLEQFDPCASYQPVDLFRGRFVVMYHGQLSPGRGLDKALLALDIVRHEFPEVFAFFIGSGAMKEKLAEMIDTLKLCNHAMVSDPVPHSEVPRFLKSTDIGILPFPDHEWWRGQSPIKLFEYFAMETPVIATNIPMNRSVIGTHDCAFIIPDNSPAQIAAAIRQAITEKERLPRMGAVGRQLVQSTYTWDRQAERILSYLFPDSPIEEEP